MRTASGRGIPSGSPSTSEDGSRRRDARDRIRGTSGSPRPNENCSCYESLVSRRPLRSGIARGATERQRATVFPIRDEPGSHSAQFAFLFGNPTANSVYPGILEVMSIDDPVTLWIEELRNADAAAARNLWNHFVARLYELGRKKLRPETRRVYDEEDAAQSAFHSVCAGIAAGRFPDLGSRENLWQLLVVITARKVAHRHRHDHRRGRPGGQRRLPIRRARPRDAFGRSGDPDDLLGQPRRHHVWYGPQLISARCYGQRTR